MRTVALRRRARILNGGTPTPDATNWDGSVRWATPVDLARVDGGVLVATDRTLTHLGASGSTVAPTSSVLVSCRAPIGYTAMTASSMAFNQGCKAVVPGPDLSPRFIQYVLMAHTDRLKAMGSGSTFLELSSESLASLRLPNVHLDEQRRIADFLDDRVARIDKIITARREQEKVLHERFESLRLDAVLGKHRTRPTDLPWAPAVPESWAVRRLSQLARMGTGHTPSRSEPSYWLECDVPWLTTTDVHKFRRDEIDVIESTEISISALGLANSAAVLHPSNTVALSRTASAGFSVIMGRPMATSQDFVTWTCGQDLLPEYLLHTLRVMRPYLLGFLSIGSTHKTIYFPDLMDLRIPVPPLRYQSDAVARVVEAAASRNSALTAIRQQVVLLTEYKQSLITAAVSGELDVSTAGSGIPG